MIARIHRLPMRLGVALILLAMAPAVADEGASDSAALRNYHGGNGLLQRGMFDLAADEYRAFLKAHGEHPKAPMARYGLAVCEFRRGNAEAALEQLQQLPDADDFAFDAEARLMRGQCLLLMKRPGEAAEALQGVLKHHADHKLAPDAAALLVESLFRARDFDEAIRAATSAAEMWPAHPTRERVQFFEAMAFSAIGKHDEAAQSCEAVLREFSAGALAESARLLAAQSFHRCGKLADARRRFEEIVAHGKSEQQSDALMGLAAVLMASGEFDAAGARWDEFIKTSPNHPSLPMASLQRARVWFERGEYDRSAALLKEAAKADQTLADEADYWLAKCDSRKGEFASAAKRLRAAVKKYPKSRLHAELLYDYGVALYRAADYADAAKVLSRFVKEQPDHAFAAEALHLSAMALHQQAEYAASADLCEDFIKRYPKHHLMSEVKILAAENLFLSGEFADAIKRYRTFLEAHPKSPDADRASYRLGLAHHRLGKFSEAVPLLEKSLKSKDAASFASAMPALGDACFELGRWQKADAILTDYAKEHARADGVDSAMLKCALARQRLEKFDAALDMLSRLTSEHPESPHALQAIFETGQCLAALGRGDEAEKRFTQVLDLDENSRFASHALRHLGQIAQARGDHDKAAEYLAKADNGLPKDLADDARYSRAQSLMAAKKYADAEELLRSVMKKTKDPVRKLAARASLSIAVSRQDRTGEALKLIDDLDLSELHPTMRDAIRYERAWCLKQLGRTDDAMTAYRNLIDGDSATPTNPHALLELAVMEDAAGHRKKAAELYRRAQDAATLAGDAAASDVAEQAAYRLGVCEFEQGKFAEAASQLDKFTKEHSGSTMALSAHALCGESLFKLNRHAAAVEHFQVVIDKGSADSGFAGALLRMAECQSALQRWAIGEKHFADYLKQFPEAENAYQAAFGLAWCQENQGRLDEAVKGYRRVIETHQGPTAARAQFQIGECLFAGKKYEDAARELMKVDILYAYPEWSAAALYEAGRCFAKLSRHVEARRQFEQVSKKYADTRWAALAAEQLREAVAGVPGH